MSKVDKSILVGRIVAPQGIRGEVRVQTFTEKPSDFKNLAAFGRGIESKALHFVRTVPNTNVIIARIDGVSDRNTAEDLRGAELFINRNNLPPTKPDEYYQADLLGFAIIQDGKNIGVIDGFQNFGAGDIIETTDGNMFSFIGATIDMENKTVKLK